MENSLIIRVGEQEAPTLKPLGWSNEIISRCKLEKSKSSKKIGIRNKCELKKNKRRDWCFRKNMLKYIKIHNIWQKTLRAGTSYEYFLWSTAWAVLETELPSLFEKKPEITIYKISAAVWCRLSIILYKESLFLITNIKWEWL